MRYSWLTLSLSLDYAIANKLTPFISMQNHYSLVYREEEREMMPTLKVCIYNLHILSPSLNTYHPSSRLTIHGLVNSRGLTAFWSWLHPLVSTRSRTSHT